MKILVTGNYDTTYNRTIILIKGLKKRNDLEITEYPIRDLKRFDKKQFKNIAIGKDYIYLPPFTHPSVRIIKKMVPVIPLIFDPLISKYLTKVTDYKQISKYSPRALKNYYKDKIPLKNSDVILADTLENKKYYVSMFGVPAEKIFVLPIGVDTSEFYPENNVKKSDFFEIGFYGGFIPLQGLRNIVDTALYLHNDTDIRFTIIGDGFESDMIRSYVKKLDLKNIVFTGLVEYEKLSSMINTFDICLGIFGETPKADMVIPNKVFHYAAVKKCIISKNSPGIKEVFTDKSDIILTSTNPQEIAEKILFLKQNPLFRNNIAENAYKLVSEEYNADKIAERFCKIVNSVKV